MSPVPIRLNSSLKCNKRWRAVHLGTLADFTPALARSATGSGSIAIIRIEHAVAFLAMACSTACSADPTRSQGEGANLYALIDDLVIKRARDIYGQGRV